MKIASAFFFFFSVTLIFFSCNNRDENGSTDTSNTNSTKSITDSTRGDKPTDTSLVTKTVTDNESKDFIIKACSGGLMEVEAGKLAQQNAKNMRVKAFGSMMVADHTKANEELKSIAASKKTPVPAAMLPEEQKHIDLMSKMKGAEFDKFYMDMMLNDHKKDVGEFEGASKGLKDSDLRSFAKKTLPVLKKHLDSAQAIHNKM